MAGNHEPGTVLEVKAGPHDRKNAFVAFECGGGCDCQTGHTLYELDESGNRGAIVPCQCLTDCGCEDECEGGCSEMVWMVPELKAGQTKRYVMDKAAAGAGDDDASGVAMMYPRAGDIRPRAAMWSRRALLGRTATRSTAPGAPR